MVIINNEVINILLVFTILCITTPTLSSKYRKKKKQRKKNWVFQKLAVCPLPLKSIDAQQYEAENKHDVKVIIWDSIMYYEGNLKSSMIPKNG